PAIPHGYRVSAGSVGLVEQTIFQILDPYDARYRHIVAICALVGEKQIDRFRASHDHAVNSPPSSKTDGWSGYPGAAGSTDDPHVVGKMASHIGGSCLGFTGSFPTSRSGP